MLDTTHTDKMLHRCHYDGNLIRYPLSLTLIFVIHLLVQQLVKYAALVQSTEYRGYKVHRVFPFKAVSLYTLAANFWR